MITPLKMKKLTGPAPLKMKKLSLRGATQRAKVPGTSYSYFGKRKKRKVPGTNYSYFKKGPTRRIGAPRAKIKQIGRVGTHRGYAG